MFERRAFGSESEQSPKIPLSFDFDYFDGREMEFDEFFSKSELDELPSASNCDIAFCINICESCDSEQRHGALKNLLSWLLIQNDKIQEKVLLLESHGFSLSIFTLLKMKNK